MSEMQHARDAGWFSYVDDHRIDLLVSGWSSRSAGRQKSDHLPELPVHLARLIAVT
jgi:hypothetical protein